MNENATVRRAEHKPAILAARRRRQAAHNELRSASRRLYSARRSAYGHLELRWEIKVASTGHGSKPQGKSAAVALGITFLALLGLVLTELLSKVMPGIPQPMPWGMPIAIVIVAATIFRFLLENALASEPQHIEKYTLEMSMAGTVALVSLAIVQLHDSTVDRFQAGTLILNGVGYASESSLETAAVLSALAFLVTGVCILAAFLSKRFKEGDLETVIRALSVPILVLSYVLFFMTVIYVK